MSRPLWFVELLKKLFPSRYMLAKFTYFQPFGSLVDKLLFDRDDLIYLPLDTTIQINESIPVYEDIVLPSDIVEYFINKSDYHWVMDYCICRNANHCEDFPEDLGCIFLGEAVSQINPKLGRMVSKTEAIEHAQRCRDAGLVHMIGRNKLDSVWLGAGPIHKLLTICNCCPCCCLWKFLPDINKIIGDKVSKMPGVEITVTDLCVGCGSCLDSICFVDSIHLVYGRAEIDKTCRICGRCVVACPNNAIEISLTNPEFAFEVINRISMSLDLKIAHNSA